MMGDVLVFVPPIPRRLLCIRVERNFLRIVADIRNSAPEEFVDRFARRRKEYIRNKLCIREYKNLI